MASLDADVMGACVGNSDGDRVGLLVGDSLALNVALIMCMLLDVMAVDV